MLKKSIIAFLLIFGTTVFPQKLGKMAEEPKPVKFPDHAWGIDLMFGEGGFGFGTFLRRNFTKELTGFADFSISESKDEHEVQYIDYWGRTFTIGKKNRVFLLPLNFGLQYRLFSKALTENFRPYVNAGAGPTYIVTTPYELEFFNSFKEAQSYLAAGGYVGFGANFGNDRTNLFGMNLRYYFVHMFNDGVESMAGRKRKDFGSVFITLNIGVQY